MKVEIKEVEDMPVYRLFYSLAVDVEVATRDYGPDFRWLREQSLRASESAPSNMSEGFYSQYSTEYPEPHSQSVTINDDLPGPSAISH